MANITFLLFITFLINSTLGLQSNGHEETISISVETPNLKIVSAAEKQQPAEPEPEIVSTTVAVIEGGDEVVEPEAVESSTAGTAVVENETSCKNVSISRDDCNTRGISQIATIINRFGTITKLCNCESSKLSCPSGVSFLNKIDLAITRNIYNRYCSCKCDPAKKDKEPGTITNIWESFNRA